jgi:UDP-2,3-diacylglucosamine pyrophosphatase LpxH
MPESKTLILSDIHMGCRPSRFLEVERLIAQSDFSRLILLGDTFNDEHIITFSRDEKRFIAALQSLSENRPDVEVVWLKGNHDKQLPVAAGLQEIRLREEYLWEENGKRFLAIHGDQFDTFFINESVVTKLFDRLYPLLLKIDSRKLLRAAVGTFRSYFLGLSKKVAQGAATYARAKDVDVIFCGHTHMSLQKTFFAGSKKPVLYYNTGCWIKRPSTYAEVVKGVVSLKRF